MIDEINDLVTEKGFDQFAWIDGKDVEVRQWVRVKCMFGCSAYGRSVCPPNTPSVQECERFVSEYKKVLVIRIGTEAEKGNYPREWSKDATQCLLDLEKAIFKLNYPKTFLLNQTCCGKCEKCVNTREDCKHMDYARPSPESFAIDVYSTVRKVGMEINVMTESKGSMTRIAMIFID